MKTLYTLLLLFIVTAAFSQKNKLPEIPYNWYKAKVSEYYKQLGIRDKSAIIVTVGELPNYRDETFKYAVYFKDGSIKMFTEDDNVITEVTVSDHVKSVLRDFLFLTNWTEIANYNLSGQHEEDKYLITLDGTINYLDIIQGDKEFSIYTQHTLSNIERKVPGWEDRVKFLELIKTFENYFK